MSSMLIRAEISEKNRYWIDKHRHYELKHFCLQYPSWKRSYEECNDSIIFASSIENTSSSGMTSDLTAKHAIKKAQYAGRIKMIEDAANKTDEFLSDYILKAVTEGLSYTYLKSKLNIPCGRDLYYERYRRFFWILNGLRD